jgi:hypothetical protein
MFTVLTIVNDVNGVKGKARGPRRVNESGPGGYAPPARDCRSAAPPCGGVRYGRLIVMSVPSRLTWKVALKALPAFSAL